MTGLRPSTDGRRIAWGCSLILLAACMGCGIHYYDSKTGVEHLFGFGHMRMRVPPATNGVEAIIKGYSVVGLKVGGSQEDYGVSLGYDDRRLILVNPTNAAFSLEWPKAGWFNLRIGTNMTFLPQSPRPKPGNSEKQAP